MAKNSPQDIKNREYFSLKLNELMAEKGVRQIDLHNKLGIPKSTLTGYVKGRSLPTAGNLQKLSDFFGVKKSYLDLRFNPKEENNQIKLIDSWLSGMLEFVINGESTTDENQIPSESIEYMLDYYRKINSIAFEFAESLLRGESKYDINERLLKKYSQKDLILAMRFLKVFGTYIDEEESKN